MRVGIPKEIKVKENRVACTPGGGSIYWTLENEVKIQDLSLPNDISVFDARELKWAKNLSAGNGPWSMALSPDSSRILVTNMKSRFSDVRKPFVSEVTSIETSRASVDDRRVVPGANLMMGVAWHPSGEFALATLNRASGRELGLSRGANVVMPNLTPVAYRALYEIYPAKACIGETAAECGACLTRRIEAGAITGGMRWKALACQAALAGGVERVHVLDGRLPHTVIAELFTDRGVGTLVTAAPAGGAP